MLPLESFGEGVAEAAWQESLKDLQNLAGPPRPRPEIAETDDPSTQLGKLRQWALSLSAPRMARGQLRGVSLEQFPDLPPLNVPPLPYVQRGVLQEAGEMQARGRLMAPTPFSDAPVNSSYEDPAKPWPPKVSQLGLSSTVREAPLVMRGLQSSVAVEAVARADANRFQRHRRLACTTTEECQLSYDGRPPFQRVATMRSEAGKRIMNASDPMAGSLFSRDTVLDKEMVRHGLYEGQLRKQRDRQRLPLTAR
eukprot:TRINITY_DN35847_c0_g1_i1.p1 TRINITY_DN35847_c0_g1~~TRINITY_DN35847_c0_g1_i1.p1  ORF type:complete len:252 (-),score=34.75 TRINITY_DN35847_c0_g1_i1:171-926(-)